MNRPIKLWEFLVSILGAVITVSTLIYNRGSMEGSTYQKQINIERRLDGHDAQLKEIKEEMAASNLRIEAKVDRLTESISEIKVMLQNKQDRK